MPTTTGLFQKLTSWRHGHVRSAGGRTADEKIAALEDAVEQFDRRGRDLERYLEQVNQMLNFGMVAGACKDIQSRIATTAITTVNTVAPVDLTGAVLNITPDYDLQMLVIAVFDIQQTVLGGPSVFIGTIVVDGTARAPQAIIDMRGVAASGIRLTATQVVSLTLSAKAAHTIKLQGAVNVVGGTYVCNPTHTGFAYHAAPIAPF